jgi:hypothetical protein
MVAAAASAAVVLSAPFSQQLFSIVSDTWPRQSRALGIGATAVPVAAAVVAAAIRIRDRRLPRYAALASALTIGGGYIQLGALSFTETFHFVEYGLLGCLWYLAFGGVSAPAPTATDDDILDASSILLPLLAGVIVGSADEWFQWFIPIRAGEARDVGLNVIATACGVLFAVAFAAPTRLRGALTAASSRRLVRWTAAAVLAFALFFQTVHVGYDVTDPDIGSFRSLYTAAELERAAGDRAKRWRIDPPLVQRRLSSEDHYLTEGLWHVRRRNEAWGASDVATAWRENLILEKFYAPVLDASSYAGVSGQRWPAEQREDAAARAASGFKPYTSDAYAYPLYALPKRIF